MVIFFVLLFPKTEVLKRQSSIQIVAEKEKIAEILPVY